MWKMETKQMIETDQMDMMEQQTEMDSAEQPRVVDISGISTGLERENLSKFQRVAAGFFAQTREPALTINGKTVGVNAAAARLFPDVDYMEILISTEDKKVAFKPCDELNISGYKWAKTKDGKRYSTQRTGEPFVLCICQIMGWDPNNRYRILGKKVLDETDEEILCFDLKAGQGFEKAGPDAKGKTRSTILTGWDGTFGPNYSPNEGSVHIDTFDGYTVFSIGKKRKTVDMSDSNGEATSSEASAKQVPDVQTGGSNDASVNDAKSAETGEKE